MRIALLAPGFSQHAHDWAIPALQQLACRLAQAHEVHVFSLRYPAPGRYHFCQLTHTALGGGTRFGLRSLPIWLQTVRALVTAHRQRPFDILHAFWIDEPGLVGVLARHLIKRPLLASIGGGELVYFPDIPYGTAGSRLRRALIQFTLKHADAITAGSPYQLEMAHTTRPKCLAPLGIDTHQFCPAPPPAWQQPTLIQAASLVGVKDQALLLEIVAQVKTAVPTLRLILAGDGPLKENLRHLAHHLNLEPHITWLNNIAYTQMPTIYQQAHLYLQTSRHESQGVAVLEAMACGLPVLGTPVGLMPEVACLPATSDKKGLAQQVTAVLTDQTAYTQRRQAARQVVAEQYDLTVTTNRFLDLYHSLVGMPI